MRELAGKTAFVTGGASGIGLALGRAFAEAGMRVMLADIEEAALAAAVDSLRPLGPEVRGVAGGGGIDTIALDTWRWVLDVNLMGVLHGIRAFLPHIRAHGEGGHIVNTASMAGLQSGLGFSPYAASKYAVVAMSEGLARELAPHGIGVSVLCPSFVRSRISESAHNRPERYGPAVKPQPGSAGAALAAHLAERSAAGLDPAKVAAATLRAIRDDELYVFTHPERQGEMHERFAAILAAMDKAARAAELG